MMQPYVVQNNITNTPALVMIARDRVQIILPLAGWHTMMYRSTATETVNQEEIQADMLNIKWA
jgi:hypothetical protein